MKKNKKFLMLSVSAGSVFMPLLALAANAQSTCTSINNITGVFACFAGLIQQAIIVLIFLASLFFIWNLVQYIREYDSEQKRTESRQFMIYGIIALFVMISAWELVGVLSRTFGFSGEPQYGNQQSLPVTTP